MDIQPAKFRSSEEEGMYVQFIGVRVLSRPRSSLPWTAADRHDRELHSHRLLSLSLLLHGKLHSHVYPRRPDSDDMTRMLHLSGSITLAPSDSGHRLSSSQPQSPGRIRRRTGLGGAGDSNRPTQPLPPTTRPTTADQLPARNLAQNLLPPQTTTRTSLPLPLDPSEIGGGWRHRKLEDRPWKRNRRARVAAPNIWGRSYCGASSRGSWETFLSLWRHHHHHHHQQQQKESGGGAIYIEFDPPLNIICLCKLSYHKHRIIKIMTKEHIKKKVTILPRIIHFWTGERHRSGWDPKGKPFSL